MWQNEGHGLVRCLELQPKYGTDSGIYVRETCKYHLKNRADISFKISKIRGWFFKGGDGYLTLHIR